MTDVSEASDFLDQQRQAGLGQAVTSVDDDPDAAARAIQIGKASGVPPIVVHDDLEGYEAQHKAALTHDILRNNPYLQAYAAHDPMAAKVSNDDWGQLDKVHQVLDKYNSAMKTLGLDNTVLFGMGPKLLPETLKTIKEGLQGMITAPQKILGLTEPEDTEGLGPKTEAKATELGASPEQAKQIARTALERHQRGEGMTGALFGIPTIIGAPVIAAFKEFISKPLEGATGFPAETAEGLAFAALAALGIRHAGDMGKSAQQAHDAITKAEPYMQAGKPTPPGLDPTIDKMHIEQSKQDLKSLDDLLKESQKSTTRERAPEYYEKVLALKEQGEIGISADAIAKLYGDKMPGPDDGLLGHFIPDLEKQMYLALSSGGDVRAPISKWLAFVDPEIAKQLHDDIRPRKGGVTKAEGEVLKQQFAEGEDPNKTRFEQEQEDFRDKNELPPATPEEMISLLQGRIKQIEYDRGLNKVEGEEYPPNAELMRLRNRVKELSIPAVVNVRTAAKLDPLFDWSAIKSIEGEMRFGEWEPLGKGVEQFTPEKWTEFESSVADVVEKELAKIVPKKVEVAFAADIRRADNKAGIGGVYTQYVQREPTIVLALAKQIDIPGVGRHEAIHHLRAYNFFSEAEWQTLTDVARDEDWISKEREGKGTSVADKYGKKGLDAEQLLEEAVADEFRYWNRNPDHPTLAAKIFEKLRDFLQKLKSSWDELATKNPEVNAIFKQIESGEIGRREGTKPRHPKAFDQFSEGKQGELDVTRQEDKKLFATIAGWMNKAQQAKYMDLIAKRNAEDADFQLKKAERLERKRQSEEWKQNEAELRPEIEKDVRDRPDMQALEFFRSGKLYGEETGTRPRVDPSKLTEEQRKAFPEKYQRRDGMNPSDVANLFGYTSFDELAAKLTQRDAELGSKTTAQFLKGIVDKELEQRMLAEYGDKEENILREAQEHVISPTQMDLLYEQVVAFGMRAGSKMSFTKADFKAWVQEGFKDAKAAGVSVENYLRDSGKTGRDIRDALLKGDPLTAFKQEQRQLMAMMMADEAIKFEKLQGRTERLMNKYARRANVPSIAQEYTDQVHQLLKSVGDNIRRTEANIALSSQGKSLTDFIAEKNAAGDGIMDPMLPPGKALKDFTVEEYTAFANTLKSLDYNGKEAKTIQVGWDKLEKSDAIEGVVESLEPLKKFDIKEAPPKGLARRLAREVDARLIKVEQLADWIDHNDPRGWFNQTVVRPLYSALHKRGDTIAKLAEDVRAIPVDREWGRALNDAAGNTLLRDAEGRTIPLTNENKIAIALNMGNESNKSVLLRGHKWDEASVTSFLQDKMTDMDWAFVEGMWKVFDKIAPFVTEATTKRTGVPIEMVQPSAILGHKGGYYPLIKDPLEALVGKQVETDLVDKPFFDPLPMARALKLRTGIAYPLDLSINSIASRINETLHAALFQDPIRNARKITAAEPVRRGIAEAFGSEYVEQIDAWLKDIANNGGENSNAKAAWWSRNLRENVVYGLMAYKVSTAAIHALSAGTASAYEVGPVHLAKNMKDLGIAQIMPDVARRFFANEKQMWEQVDWAHETFPELRTRMQDIGRDMQAQLANIVRKGLLDDAAAIRAKNIVWGMKMVATLDQLTATPVAIAAYRKAIAEGWSHEDAAYAGDKAVRTAHGSPSLVGRANIGRGEINKWLTIAYNGYWNHNYNRSRSAVRDVKNPEIDFTDKLMVGSAALTAFIIAPAIYHYAIRGSDNDTWTGAASEAILSQFGGQVPIVNTLMHSFMHNRDPHVSPFDTLLEAAYNVKKDIWNLAQGKKADKYLKHVVELPGYFTGLGASGQLGTVAQFNKDVMQNKQRPHSILEWARGEVTGEAKPKGKRR